MQQQGPTQAWIEELIDAIGKSSLSDAKKMLYLYALADGSFSENHFEQLSQDIAEAGKALAADIAAKQASVADLETELQQVKVDMGQTSIDEAESYGQGLETFVSEVSDEVAAEKHASIKQTL